MSNLVQLSSAQENLAKYINDVNNSRDALIIQSEGKEDLALISASELEGLMETAHLLDSVENIAKNLLLESVNLNH